MSIKPKTLFSVRGSGKFNFINAQTWARSENEAIKNVAYKYNLIQDDLYEYFKSRAIVKILKSPISKYSYGLARWVGRQA